MIGVISVFFICVSILSFCLKTHPDMRVPVIRNITIRTGNNLTAWTLDKHRWQPLISMAGRKINGKQNPILLVDATCPQNQFNTGFAVLGLGAATIKIKLAKLILWAGCKIAAFPALPQIEKGNNVECRDWQLWPRVWPAMLSVRPRSTNAHDAFFFIECICNAWFTIEIFVR